jgi:hypothetical protein
MNAWFDDFAARCAQIAARHGTTIDPPQLDSTVAHEVLDLTRVVAHTSERQFAPLAAFVAGQAIQGMLASNPSLPPTDLVAFIAELKHEIPGGQQSPSAQG